MGIRNLDLNLDGVVTRQHTGGKCRIKRVVASDGDIVRGFSLDDLMVIVDVGVSLGVVWVVADGYD